MLQGAVEGRGPIGGRGLFGARRSGDRFTGVPRRRPGSPCRSGADRKGRSVPTAGAAGGSRSVAGHLRARKRAAGMLVCACLVVGATFVAEPKASAASGADVSLSLGGTIAKIAESQVGVGDTPASTNWSEDCDPYTTMVGVRVSSAGCGKSRRFG